jgi:hypothetical protein
MSFRLGQNTARSDGAGGDGEYIVMEEVGNENAKCLEIERR